MSKSRTAAESMRVGLVFSGARPPPRGFLGSSVGKETACSAGDLGSIPGSGRPLEKEMATHSSTLVWEIPWTEERGRLHPRGHKESDMTERLHFTSLIALGEVLGVA